jgi:hypothetical protein
MKKQIEYVSEMTRFIQELHAQRPHLAEEQRKARARWCQRAVPAPVCASGRCSRSLAPLGKARAR